MARTEVRGLVRLEPETDAFTVTTAGGTIPGSPMIAAVILEVGIAAGTTAPAKDWVVWPIVARPPIMAVVVAVHSRRAPAAVTVPGPVNVTVSSGIVSPTAMASPIQVHVGAVAAGHDQPVPEADQAEDPGGRSPVATIDREAPPSALGPRLRTLRVAVAGAPTTYS